ncbi:hypothetical protein N7495_005887 [Penicillium taxi]|uniref:uncharacterized protein n=1 Tax=Penicillium taxi TaxID=168475 RepID=UPI00254526F7|nr:uncharacterized protein N7495_005887 [Penicillium taxi]KAJ5894196.1 hypothetical protein N7495_005887 [Penicillium taxi]
MLLDILIQTIWIVSVLAAPADILKSNRSFAKRTSPEIADGFTTQHKTQITDGFKDALRLAKTVQTAPDATVDTILEKYFDSSDKETVMDLFKKITGSDDQYAGNSILSQMNVVQDYADKKGKMGCYDPTIYAVTRRYTTSTPKMIICDSGFAFGGIDKSYTDVSAVTCSTIGSIVSKKMDFLGATILHEYTHWRSLVVPPLSEETDDLDGGYGPWEAQETVPKSEALKNADNFTWFAIELFWTVHCGREFAAPELDSDEDCDSDDY